jgi:hypothetical protein
MLDSSNDICCCYCCWTAVPAGLQDLPCSGYVDAKPYFVCDPWDIGEGVFYQIYAAVFFTVAQMVGTRIQGRGGTSLAI